MSKKLKTAAAVKQPLTADFYADKEELMEDIPLTPEIEDELKTLAKCYAKKKPENRLKLWREYQQSLVVERDSSASEAEPEEPKSRAAEVAELGPLARAIHYPLRPLKLDIEVNIDQEFTDWMHALPSTGIPELDPFKFLSSQLQHSFEFMRLALETRLDSFMADTTWDQVFKSHGFMRFSCSVTHPTYSFMAFKSPRFYVVLVLNRDGIFLNYLVHEN
jgi:hypothetical protein